jgi:hypothetical protein
LVVDWLFSTADIVFLVTVLSSHVSLRSSYQQLIFQTRFTVKNCSLISSASLLSSVCAEPWTSVYEVVTIVMRACGSCRGDA